MQILHILESMIFLKLMCRDILRHCLHDGNERLACPIMSTFNGASLHAVRAEIMTHMTGSHPIKQSRGIICPKDINSRASRNSSMARPRRTGIKQITALAREEPQDRLLIQANSIGHHDSDQISQGEGGRRSARLHRLTRPRSDQPLSERRRTDVE